MATGLEQTAVNPHNLQSGQVRRSVGGLAATALDPLRRAYQAYQRSIGQPFQQAVRGGVRGYFGLPMMTDADALGREAYRQAEALGYTPGVGMPAGAVRLAAEGVQALPSIAGDIGRVIAGMPSGAGAAQAEDFARYQRSIPPSDVSPLTAFHGTPQAAPDALEKFDIVNINPLVIEPPHDVRDQKKLNNLVKSMKSKGWQGRPILAYDIGRGPEALTGSHRIAAAREAGIEEIPVVMVHPDIADYVDDFGRSIVDASFLEADDAAKYLRKFGDKDAAELMDIEDAAQNAKWKKNK